MLSQASRGCYTLQYTCMVLGQRMVNVQFRPHNLVSKPTLETLLIKSEMFESPRRISAIRIAYQTLLWFPTPAPTALVRLWDVHGLAKDWVKTSSQQHRQFFFQVPGVVLGRRVRPIPPRSGQICLEVAAAKHAGKRLKLPLLTLPVNKDPELLSLVATQCWLENDGK